MSAHFDDAAVRRLLRLEALIPAMRRALVALSAGDVVQPLRTVLELPEARGLLFMKPVIAGDVMAVKLITQIPANAGRGLPTMLATLVLMDAASGRTLAVMDATSLTALRTAAVSAVAADALTPGGPKILALLGSGVLARTHAAAMRAVRPLSEIRVWSRSATNFVACAKEVGGIALEDAEAAVRGADLVCTLTNAAEPVLRGAWLKPGAFVAAVGAVRPDWRELDDVAMHDSVVVVDSREAACSESGDVIGSRAALYAELGEILAGVRPAPAAGATVVFKALGQAVEDAFAAQLVWRASENGVPKP